VPDGAGVAVERCGGQPLLQKVRKRGSRWSDIARFDTRLVSIEWALVAETIRETGLSVGE
jgi:hypothetical protein